MSSNFPKIERDIAVEIDSEIKSEEILEVIKKSGTELLRNISLFDIYRNKQMNKNKKSLGFSLVFQSKKKTLVDFEVDNLVDVIITQLMKKLNAKQR